MFLVLLLMPIASHGEEITMEFEELSAPAYPLLDKSNDILTFKMEVRKTFYKTKHRESLEKFLEKTRKSSNKKFVKLVNAFKKSVEKKTKKALKAYKSLRKDQPAATEKHGKLIDEYAKAIINDSLENFNQQYQALINEIKDNVAKKIKKEKKWRLSEDDIKWTHDDIKLAAADNAMQRITESFATGSMDRVKKETFKQEVGHTDLTRLVVVTLGADLPNIEQALPESDVSFYIEGQAAASMYRNATVHALLFEAGLDRIKEIAGALKSELEKIDEKVGAHEYDEPGQAEKAIEASYKTAEGHIEKHVTDAMNDAWAKLAREKKEYTAYKVKSGVAVIAKGAGVVGGVLGAVGSGIGGQAYGTVLGVIGAIRSAVDLVQEVRNLAVEAETLAKEIQKGLTKLKLDLEEASNTTVGVREVGTAVLQRLTKIKVNSIKNLGDKNKQYKNKLKGYKGKAISLGEKIKAALDEMDALSQNIKKLEAQAESAGTRDFRKSLEQLNKVLAKSEAALDKLLNSAVGFMERYNEGMENAKKFDGWLNALKEKQPAWSDKLNKYVVPFLDFAFINPTSSAPSLAVSLAATSVKVVDDIAISATKAGDEFKALNEGQKAIFGGAKIVMKVVKIAGS